MAKEKKEPPPPTAVEILEEFASKDDRPMQEVLNRITDFVAKMEKIHDPVRGEAYPLDNIAYCPVCVSLDGGSARWPCATIKNVRRFLQPGD